MKQNKDPSFKLLKLYIVILIAETEDSVNYREGQKDKTKKRLKGPEPERRQGTMETDKRQEMSANVVATKNLSSNRNNLSQPHQCSEMLSKWRPQLTAPTSLFLHSFIFCFSTCPSYIFIVRQLTLTSLLVIQTPLNKTYKLWFATSFKPLSSNVMLKLQTQFESSPIHKGPTVTFLKHKYQVIQVMNTK